MEQIAERPAPARADAARTWDWQSVEAALLKAIDTVRRMPGLGMGGGRSAWPDYARDAWFAYDAKDSPPVRPALPAPEDITRLDQVLGWLALIPEERDRRVVQWRLRGYGWNRIMRADGRSRMTLHTRYRSGLNWIAATLNQNGVKVF